MFPVNTTVLAMACGNLQPYNRTGIEAIGVKATTLALADKGSVDLPYTVAAQEKPSRLRLILLEIEAAEEGMA